MKDRNQLRDRLQALSIHAPVDRAKKKHDGGAKLSNKTCHTKDPQSERGVPRD